MYLFNITPLCLSHTFYKGFKIQLTKNESQFNKNVYIVIKLYGDITKLVLYRIVFNVFFIFINIQFKIATIEGNEKSNLLNNKRLNNIFFTST